MFSVKSGKPIAVISTGPHEGEILGITEDEDDDSLGPDIEFKQGRLLPFLDLENRAVRYIAGPSGVGKSTYVAGLVKRYLKINPGSDVYVFSRGLISEDPAFAEILPHIKQAEIGEELLKNIPDPLKMPEGTMWIFDDVGTIHENKLRKAVEKIICDALEVGRKAKLYVLLTSHLIIPNDKNFARTVMNEMSSLVVFPKGGNSQQITYVLKQYCGMTAKQIKRVITLPSRWVQVQRGFPPFVMFEKGAYML